MPKGNYLGKARKNFHVSKDGMQTMEQLAFYWGVHCSDILELAVREKFLRDLPDVPLPQSVSPWKDPLRYPTVEPQKKK